MSQIHLFALRADWVRIFDLVEDGNELQYAPRDQPRNGSLKRVLQGRDLPGLGRAAGDQVVACDSWVCGSRDVELRLRPIDAEDGTRRYAMDQLWNPDTTVVTTGGVWNQGTIICGNVGTRAKAGEGMRLQRLFASHIRKSSTKIGMFWVAPEALNCLEAGWRLCTASASSPPEYDLSRPG